MKSDIKKFRVLLLLLVSALTYIIPAHAQSILLSESFETGNGSTPPAGWTIQQVTGTTPGISFVGSGSNPNLSTAFDGLRFVRYNSYNISSGSTRLKRDIPLSTLNKTLVVVDFAWYEDPGYVISTDKVEVQWSTNGTDWTTAGSFNRYSAVAGWKLKAVVLPEAALNQETLYIAFLFTSAYGNDCSLDMVHVTAGPPLSQSIFTLGNGTSTVGFPFYTFYMGSRTQMLYTSSDLIAAGGVPDSILSIGFDVVTVSSQVMNNFTIKMGHTLATTLTAWATTVLQTVFQQNYTVPGAGWQDIALTSPFLWDGSSNIIVEICFGDNGSYTTNSTVLGTPVTDRTVHYHRDNYAGCTGTATGGVQSITPNIRFSQPSNNNGALIGYIRNSVTNAPISGAIIMAGTKYDTTDGSGFFTFNNLPDGTVATNVSATGYFASSVNVSVTGGQATMLELLLVPGPQVSGVVTDSVTGQPIVGAEISIAGILQTLSTANGEFITPAISLTGPQQILISKTGYENYTGTVTLAANTIVVNNAMLVPLSVPPGPIIATLTGSPGMAVNLNWGAPMGNFQLIYDDGIQDNFTLWAASGNLNALKFSAPGYPVTLIGGKVFLGSINNYPASALPLNPFRMLAMKADGAGGLPGTIIDSTEITPLGFGWADFSFPAPVTLNSGDFYLVMRQGGTPPHAAGLGVDLTNPSFRSYSKFASGGGSWLAASGTFMIRAIVQGPGGPLMMDGMGDNPMNLSSAPILSQPPDAQSNTNLLSYRVSRLRLGEENDPSSWTVIYSGGATSYTDFYWPVLSSGPYRWAVQAVYAPPIQSPSTPSFSNVIGKDWTTSVNVQVSQACSTLPLCGSFIELVNIDYPDTAYSSTTDSLGFVSFSNVWKGNYQLRVSRLFFTTHTQSVTVQDSTTIKIILLADPQPVSGLTVNSGTLKVAWKAPKGHFYHLKENFDNGFTENQWTLSGGTNWMTSFTAGNPAPSASFSGTPVVSGYHQYLTSKMLSGINAPKLTLKYDIFLDNYIPGFSNSLAVELWNGITWLTIRTYQNTGGFLSWEEEEADISSVTGIENFQIRFHVYGSNSFDINSWNIDNVEVFSHDSVTGSHPCLIGYNVYLNDALSAFVQDTIYMIPPNQILYGENYDICVKAEYGFISSPETCESIQADYLCPVPSLAVETVECNSVLTWTKPFFFNDGLITENASLRTEFENPHNEYSPVVFSTRRESEGMETIWDVLYSWNTTAESEAGVDMSGDYIYTTLWNGSSFRKYQATTGLLLETFEIPGVGNIRDLAYDGSHFWYGGANAESSIYKMDFNSKTLVATIPTSVPSVRHCGYDPANGGRLWVGGWTDMYLVSLNGSIIATGPAQLNAYGNSYDPDPSGPYLWVNAQNGSSQCELEQFKITGTSLTSTGLVHDLGAIPGFNSGVAGGLGSGIIGQKFVLWANIQQTPNLIAAIELYAASGGGGVAPSGIVGYNIYRNNSFIANIPDPDSLLYIDYGLSPGIYSYDITAVYDLTPYGFPGETGESSFNTMGSQTIDLICGEPLPFAESWDEGSFLYNNWENTRYWILDNVAGNPSPSVIFDPDSLVMDYTHNLVTPFFNAGDWTCADLYLDFDLKLSDITADGNEHLKIQIYYEGNWRQLAEFSNFGPTNWNYYHIKINPVAGASFRIRFMATGANSGNIDKWHLDNIRIYAVCNPPENLTAVQSAQSTTLTWQPPDCPNQTPTLQIKLFQWSGTPNNGYYQQFNAGYGVVYDLTSWPFASLLKLDFHHLAWGVSGLWQYKIHIVDWTTYSEIGTIGPLTTTGNNIWENNISLGNLPDAGGKLIGIILEPLGNLPNNAYPCLSSDDNGIDGASIFGPISDYSAFAPSAIGDFLLNLWIEVPLADGLTSANRLQIKPSNSTFPEKPRKTPRTVGTHDNMLTISQVYTAGNQSDFSSVMGYNVYRSNNNGLPPFSKLNPMPLINTEFTDLYPASLESGLFRYYVTSIYSGSSTGLPIPCEPATDTLNVAFPDYHFDPVWYGTPIDPMTIMTLEASVNNQDLGEGDEIAIFDGNLCVGVKTLNAPISPAAPLQIILSKDNPATPAIDGYTPSHNITYKIWKSAANLEIQNVSASFPYAPLFANSTFTPFATSVVILNGSQVPVSLILQGINIAAYQSNCYNASEIITVGGNGNYFHVQPLASATLIAGQKIRFLPGTKAFNGSYLHAYITPNGQFCNTPNPFPPSDQQVVLPNELPEKLSLSVQPNPTDSKFSLVCHFDVKKPCRIALFNMSGEKIIDSEYPANEIFELNLEKFPSGIYLICFSTDQFYWTGKVVKLKGITSK